MRFQFVVDMGLAAAGNMMEGNSSHSLKEIKTWVHTKPYIGVLVITRWSPTITQAFSW